MFDVKSIETLPTDIGFIFDSIYITLREDIFAGF